MDNTLELAVELANKIRFSGEFATPLSLDDIAAQERLRTHVSQNALRISPLVTSVLAEKLVLVCDRLSIPYNSVDAYIYASPEISADCFAATREKCVVRFSSGLIDLLGGEEFLFVAGHELGHFLLRHGLTSSTGRGQSLEYFMRLRRQEISADRFGLVACQSLDVGIRALMKTISGLNDRHLRFDVGAFLSQLRSISHTSHIGATNTHPSVLVRCRDLLWFSTLNVGKAGYSYAADELLRIDRRIEDDLHSFSDGQAQAQIKAAAEDVALWMAALRVVESKSFSTDAQRRFAGKFGMEIANKMKAYLSDFAAKDAYDHVYAKLVESRARLEELAPTDFTRLYSSIKQQTEIMFSE